MQPFQNSSENEPGPEYFLFQNFASMGHQSSTNPVNPPSSPATPSMPLPSKANNSSSVLDIDELIKATNSSLKSSPATTNSFRVENYAPTPYQKPKTPPPPPRKGLAKIWPFRRRRRKARYSEGVIYYQIAYLAAAVAGFVYAFISLPNDTENQNLYQHLAHNGASTQAEVTITDKDTYVFLPFMHKYYITYSYSVGSNGFSHQSLINEEIYNSVNPGSMINIIYAPTKPSVVEMVSDPADDLGDANYQVNKDWVILVLGFLAIGWILVDIGRNIQSKLRR